MTQMAQMNEADPQALTRLVGMGIKGALQPPGYSFLRHLRLKVFL
jgi:hypothetical protein